MLLERRLAMLCLVALPVFSSVALAQRCLLLYAPSNLMIRRIRSAAPSWRTVVRLVTLASYLVGVVHALALAIEAGAPSWLNLLVLVLAWDAIKIGGLALLISARRIVDDRGPRGRSTARHRCCMPSRPRLQ